MSRALAVLALIVLAVAAYGLAKTFDAGATSQRTCFSAAKWDAPQRYRPCVRIRRVWETGAFAYTVEDHDGTTRYSGSLGAQDR